MNRRLYRISYLTLTILEILAILFALFIYTSLLPIAPWYDECGMQVIYLLLPALIQIIVSLGFMILDHKYKLKREIMFYPLIAIALCFLPFIMFTFTAQYIPLYYIIIIAGSIIFISLLTKIIIESRKIFLSNTKKENTDNELNNK